MRTNLATLPFGWLCLVVVLSNLFHGSVLSKLKVTHDPQKARADYVSRMQQQTPPHAHVRWEACGPRTAQ